MPPMEIKEASQLWCYWNSSNVCGWCGEKQTSEQRLLCLEQIRMRTSGPSLVFQWCSCSKNFLNGAAIPKIPRGCGCTLHLHKKWLCFSSRVRLHLCLLTNGSPHAKNGVVVLKEKLHSAATLPDRCTGNRLPKVAAVFGAEDTSCGEQRSEPVVMLSKKSGCVRLMRWKANKWTSAAMLGANLDAYS